jgi:hypothetical protein
MWICKQHAECKPKDCFGACDYRHTFLVEHIFRWKRPKDGANWFRIPCYHQTFTGSNGDNIAIRWKGEK